MIIETLISIDRRGESIMIAIYLGNENIINGERVCRRRRQCITVTGGITRRRREGRRRCRVIRDRGEMKEVMMDDVVVRLGEVVMDLVIEGLFRVLIN